MKFIGIVIGIFLSLFILGACLGEDENINSNTVESNLEYNNVDVSISKYGDVNELQSANANYIVSPTSDNEFNIEGLTQNKIVLIKIKFTVSNKGEDDKVFSPLITISNSKGYSLDGYSSDTQSANILTLNEGTSSESIQVSGLSKTIGAGQSNSIVSYVFAYQCNKSSSYSITTQDWLFFDQNNNNKQIHYCHVELTFPSYYQEISSPTYTYSDSSISILTTDSNVKYASLYANDKLKNLTYNNGAYSFVVTKSGTYTIKLRSDDLLVEDFTKTFECTVLDDVSKVSFDGKKLSFKEVLNATEYIIEIKDTSGNILSSFKTSNTSNIDISDYVLNLDKGSYYVSVYASSSENLVFRSTGGTNKSFEKLSAPVVSIKNKTISWDVVNNATSYNIYKYNTETKSYELLDTTSDCSYKNSSFTLYDKFYVVAVSNNNATFDSSKSNIVECKVA